MSPPGSLSAHPLQARKEGGAGPNQAEASGERKLLPTPLRGQRDPALP